MKSQRMAMAGGLAAAGLMVATLTAHPAAAAWQGCSVPWRKGINVPYLAATGGGDQTYTGKNSLDDVSLYVKDTAADGLHVAIRLVTRRSDGSDHYWSWHHLYSGGGTSQTWNTKASDTAGIRKVFREVGVFKGTSMLSACATPGEANPQW
ncbi:hypothetical protein ACWCV9_16695 [Streptomyces sp. NPDC001606]